MITAAELLDYLNILRPAWVTTHSYAKGDYVIQSSTVYECLVGHTSGTFAADLNSGYWNATHFIQQSTDYAISKINGALNRDCRAGSYTDEFTCESSKNYIYVKNPTITAVASIKKFNADTGDWETIAEGTDDIADFAKIIDGKIQLFKGYTLNAYDTYQVVYTGGLGSGHKDLERVKGAAKEIGALHFKKSYVGNGLLGLTSRNMAGQGNESAGFNFDEAVKNILTDIMDMRMINI